MNENLDLCVILKDVPKGTEFFNSATGHEVTFDGFIKQSISGFTLLFGGFTYTSKGQMRNNPDAECVIFPSKDQRDWSKYVYKPEPKKVKVVLHPFDRVLAKGEYDGDRWDVDIFSRYRPNADKYRFVCLYSEYPYCIPYNKDTAHLLGTTDECPIDYEIEFSKDYVE